MDPELSGSKVGAVHDDRAVNGCVCNCNVPDETIQKGWGLGSGISLFIMAELLKQILWSLFSPLPAGDGGAVGVFPYIGQINVNGDVSDALFRSNQLPSIFGLFLTAEYWQY